MIFRLLILFAVVNGLQAQFLSLTTPEDVGMSSKQIALLDGVIQSDIEQKKLPGAVVLVARKGRVDQAFCVHRV